MKALPVGPLAMTEPSFTNSPLTPSRLLAAVVLPVNTVPTEFTWLSIVLLWSIVGFCAPGAWPLLLPLPPGAVLTSSAAVDAVPPSSMVLLCRLKLPDVWMLPLATITVSPWLGLPLGKAARR